MVLDSTVHRYNMQCTLVVISYKMVINANNGLLPVVGLTSRQCWCATVPSLVKKVLKPNCYVHVPFYVDVVVPICYVSH